MKKDRMMLAIPARLLHPEVWLHWHPDRMAYDDEWVVIDENEQRHSQVITSWSNREIAMAYSTYRYYSDLAKDAIIHAALKAE